MGRDQGLKAETVKILDEVYHALLAAEQRLIDIQRLVDLQAEDEGLWVQPERVSEAYLQQHLRMLHEVIEGKTSAEIAAEHLFD